LGTTIVGAASEALASAPLASKASAWVQWVVEKIAMEALATVLALSGMAGRPSFVSFPETGMTGSPVKGMMHGSLSIIYGVRILRV
jgi:hypothetical protein